MEQQNQNGCSQPAQAPLDIAGIARELARLQSENKRFQSLKERYVQFAQELTTAAASIRSGIDAVEHTARKINPVLTIQSVTGAVPGKRRHGMWDEVVKDAYGKMVAGTHVTSKLLCSMDSRLLGDAFGRQTCLQRLARMPGVVKVKDGTAVRLFVSDVARSGGSGTMVME